MHLEAVQGLSPPPTATGRRVTSSARAWDIRGRQSVPSMPAMDAAQRPTPGCWRAPCQLCVLSVCVLMTHGVHGMQRLGKASTCRVGDPIAESPACPAGPCYPSPGLPTPSARVAGGRGPATSCPLPRPASHHPWMRLGAGSAGWIGKWSTAASRQSVALAWAAPIACTSFLPAANVDREPSTPEPQQPYLLLPRCSLHGRHDHSNLGR